MIYFANGPGESSLLTSLGQAASVTTLLCVIVVTVAMVLLTLMCVCGKKTASVKLQSNSAPVTGNQVILKQLSKTEDIESQVTDANKEETNEGKLAEHVPEGSSVPATSTTQLAVTHLKDETRPASHPSPHLPPRNPHNFHASAHPTNQSSTSVQASSRASTPASVDRIHDDCVSNQTMAASSATATEGAMATKESQLPDHSRLTCRVQPDYEEMDLPEKPPSVNTKADDCDDSNIYQDIDLNEASKPRETAAKNSDSIEPYAEYKESSKKLSDVLRPQRKSSSLQTSESEAKTGVKSTTEIPEYAKVDKARKSHDASSNSSLANHLPEDGLVSQEGASCSGESRSSAHASNVAELYTQVHKPKGNVVVSNAHDKDLHVSKPHENVNGENSKPANGDMVLNPCYATTMIRNYPTGATSGPVSTQPSQVQTVEEPPYSTINDERVIVTVNPEPGYSSIYEVQGGYSEISTTTSPNNGGTGATANATGGNNPTDQISLPKEPIYELVDATARDDVSSQGI